MGEGKESRERQPEAVQISPPWRGGASDQRSAAGVGSLALKSTPWTTP